MNIFSPAYPPQVSSTTIGLRNGPYVRHVTVSPPQAQTPTPVGPTVVKPLNVKTTALVGGIGGALGAALGGVSLLTKAAIPFLGKAGSVLGIAKWGVAGAAIGAGAIALPAIASHFPKGSIMQKVIYGAGIGSAAGTVLPILGPISGAIVGAGVGAAVHLVSSGVFDGGYSYGPGYGYPYGSRYPVPMGYGMPPYGMPRVGMPGYGMPGCGPSPYGMPMPGVGMSPYGPMSRGMGIPQPYPVGVGGYPGIPFVPTASGVNPFLASYQGGTPISPAVAAGAMGVAALPATAAKKVVTKKVKKKVVHKAKAAKVVHKSVKKAHVALPVASGGGISTPQVQSLSGALPITGASMLPTM